MSPDRAQVACKSRRAQSQVVSIQYLRAFAALAVVVYHALEPTTSQLPVGAAGVDVFFVISGFIMWTVTKRESEPRSFLWRRLVRVAPMYWLATVLIAAIWVVRPSFLWMPPVFADDMLKSMLFLPHLDPWGRYSATVVQGWTLNYEMFFYLVFALVLLSPRRSHLLLLTGVLAGLVAVGAMIPDTDPIKHTYTNPLLLEFVAGVGMGWLWERGYVRGRMVGGVLVVAALAYFAWCAPLRYEFNPLRAYFWGLPAFALVMGCLCLEGSGAVPQLPLAKSLGDASYSIYLFHIPLLAVVERKLGSAPLPLYLAAGLVVCSLAGLALFRWVERPVNDFIRRVGSRPFRAPGAAAPLASAQTF